MSIVTKIIGTLAVRIGADTSGLKHGVAESEKALKGLDDRAGPLIASLAKIAAAAAAAGAALVIGLTKSSLDTIDSQSKLARQLGGTTEAVQALTRQADLAGVSKEQLAKSVQMLNARLGEAIRDGASPAAEALKRLGLSAAELSRMDADERMATLADRMKEAGLNASQQADVLKELGIRSKEVFNLLEDGGDAIRGAREEIQLFGVAVSDVDATTIERANDAMTVIGLAMTGIGNQLAVAVAPAIEHVANLFRDAAKEGGGFGDTIANVVRGLVVGFGVVPSAIHQIRLVWDETVGAIIDGINFIIRGWNALAAALPAGMLIPAKEIENTFGKLREQIGSAPTIEDWETWWDTLTAKAKESSEAVVAARSKMLGADPAESDVLTDAQEKELAREQQRLDALLEQLRVSLMTKEEAEFQSYQNQLLQLDDFYNRKMLTEAEYHRLIEAARTQHETNLADIRDRALQQELQARSDMANRIVSTMNAFGNMLAADGDKHFGLMKAISIATALVKGWEAVTSSYAAGAKIGGPPLGIAYAAMAAAQTAAQIASMRGVSSRGGGASPGGGGGGSVPEPAVEQTAAAGRQSQISIQGIGIGDIFTGKQIRNLLDRMGEEIGDGALIKVVG